MDLDKEDIANGIPLEIKELVDNDELITKVFKLTHWKS